MPYQELFHLLWFGVGIIFGMILVIQRDSNLLESLMAIVTEQEIRIRAMQRPPKIIEDGFGNIVVEFKARDNGLNCVPLPFLTKSSHN